MRNEKIVISALSKVSDGLGGYKEDYVDMYFFGKVAFSKDKMVVRLPINKSTSNIK